jgi:hypothetical protein
MVAAREILLAPGACFACTVRNPSMLREGRGRLCAVALCGVSGAGTAAMARGWELQGKQELSESMDVPTQIFIFCLLKISE